MVLTTKQELGIKEIVSRYRNKEKYVVISGFAGSGKAQPVDTVIPTPNGNRKLGDIQVGDYVFDRRGKPTKVLGIYPQGIIDNYKITLEDGRTTFCNGEHIWSYYTSRGNLAEKTTNEMIKAGLKYSGKGCFKFKIPNISNPVQFNISKKLSINPYVVGVFLGDGCCKERQLTLSSADEELVKEVSTLIGAESYIRNSDSNYSWTFLLPEDKITYYNNLKNTKFITKTFFKAYEQELCCGAEDKRIPLDYKYASIEDRYSLLQGLLDTDGSINSQDNNRFNIRYASVSFNLIKDIQDVLYSLGYKSTISQDLRKNKYSTNCYTLSINIPNEEKYKLFKLSRKKNIALEAQKHIKRKDYSKIAITNIEKLDEKTEMVCIYVDNAEHLYLTNDYIVTHNTTLVKYAIEALKVEPSKVAYATYTGKAAQVLQKKGNKNVFTLHKLLYKHILQPNGSYLRYPRDIGELDYKVVVVDEVSMVPEPMLELLFTHPVYIIMCGDPGQLPPVSKENTNTFLQNPHIFLDEIMRQATESEIIRLSMDIREGKELPFNKGSEVMILPKKELNEGMLMWADQVIVGTNATRINLNNIIRKNLGYTNELPQDGDKLICLKNYWDNITPEGNVLINGTIGEIKNPFNSFIKLPKKLVSAGDKDIILTIIGNFVSEGEQYGSLEINQDSIKESKKPAVSIETIVKMMRSKNFRNKVPLNFTYGYAITCHKSQGSEWEKVLVMEEKFPFDREEHKRWLYTAVTRASSRLVLIR